MMGVHLVVTSHILSCEHISSVQVAIVRKHGLIILFKSTWPKGWCPQRILSLVASLCPFNLSFLVHISVPDLMNLILEGWSTVKYLLAFFSCRRLKLTHLLAYSYSGIFIFLLILLGWHSLAQPDRFQVYNSINHHLHMLMHIWVLERNLC